MNEDFADSRMTAGTTLKSQLRLGLSVLVVLAGLCTIFGAVVTVAEAWHERAQARWPEVMARVDDCSLDQASTGRRNNYYIHCRLSYAVDAEQNVAHIFSSSAPSREVWQYPPNQIEPLEEWVNEHPPGTPIVVHYNPSHHTRVALVGTDMPRGGPRTASNRKLLELCAGIFLVLLTIARIARPRSAAQT